MASERWKPVVGYEGYYEVSDRGRIRGVDRLIGHPRGGTRLWRGRVLAAFPLRHGYVAVYLCRDGELKSRTLHSLVLEAFRGLRPAGTESAHEDGDRKNNHLSNLTWKTRRANHADKVRHGTTNRGVQHGLAKLTNAAVRAIRRRAPAGVRRQVLADQFGVSITTVRRVLNRECWSHV